MAKFNPFAPLTKQEQEAKENAVIEATKKLQALKDAARICLKLEQFAHYQAKRDAAEKALVELTKTIDMLDPRELWKLQSLQNELRAVCGIMTVEKDAK